MINVLNQMQAESVPQVRQQSQQQQADSRGMTHDLEQWRSSSEGAKWQQDRARLPVLTIRQDLLKQLADHDVVVVSGDTGCGKTTQVMLACTQPPTLLSTHCNSCWRTGAQAAVTGYGSSEPRVKVVSACLRQTSLEAIGYLIACTQLGPDRK